jgi:hypothetical protein
MKLTNQEKKHFNELEIEFKNVNTIPKGKFIKVGGVVVKTKKALFYDDGEAVIVKKFDDCNLLKANIFGADMFFYDNIVIKSENSLKNNS